MEEITLKEAAAWLDEHKAEFEGKAYTYDGLKRACEDGRLKAHKEGLGKRATWLVTLKDLKEFLRTNKGPGRPRKEGNEESGKDDFMRKYNAMILGLCNHKGGVAKSTSVSSLATIFAEQGLKVLVVDNDPQANVSMQFGFGVENGIEQYNDTLTLSDIYRNKASVQDVALTTKTVGVYLVPSSLSLAEVEIILPTLPGPDMRLGKALEQVRGNYDLIIIDSPPNLNKLTVNTLAASDWFLVPVEGSDALKAVATILSMATDTRDYSGSKNQFAGVFLTMVYQSRIMNAIREMAHRLYPEDCLNSEIRRATQVKEATAMTVPLPVYAPNSEVADDYRRLANEVAEKIGLKIGLKR